MDLIMPHILQAKVNKQKNKQKKTSQTRMT